MAALLLVDLQEDFLAAAAGLEPHRKAVEACAARLLAAARSAGAPVIHLLTTVRREPDERMRHWRQAGRWMCEADSPGHAPPPALRPLPNETVLEKSGFAVGTAVLAEALNALQAREPVIVAGVHSHACVRQAVLDLIQGDIEPWVARDGVGSHEPWHGAHTEIYLRQRGVAFVTTDVAVRRLSDPEDRHLQAQAPAPDVIRASVSAARRPASPIETRIAALRHAAEIVAASEDALAWRIVEEVGKPIRYARAEVQRTSALFNAVAARARAAASADERPEAWVLRRPLGSVVAITPWNNPMAIAAGQIAPALVYGNAVLWKPAPQGLRTAQDLHRIMIDAGVEPETFHIVPGDGAVGLALIADSDTGGVCFTGATATGRVVAAVCSQRNVPLQAELGGNNGAIVMPSTDLDRAAFLIADAAFGCAGQRCTATRRAIVAASAYDRFVAQLQQAVARLQWGRPDDAETVIGPLVHTEQATRVAACVSRVEADGHRILQPHLRDGARPGNAYYPATIVLCDDQDAEIVQEETFGPVLVVQRARDFDDALGRLNGVRQGLAAAIFSCESAERRRFLDQARAGILKLEQGTVEAGVDVPFCGWKLSGIGPAQHGDANLEFFTRAQAVYGDLKPGDPALTGW